MTQLPLTESTSETIQCASAVKAVHGIYRHSLAASQFPDLATLFLVISAYVIDVLVALPGPSAWLRQFLPKEMLVTPVNLSDVLILESSLT